MNELDDIRTKLANFAKERDWDQYHSPKNLAMALSVETSELMEHFQWLTEQQSKELDTEVTEAIAEEIADVQIYLLILSEKLNIDVIDAVTQKIKKNEEKYPADKVKGKTQKYLHYTSSNKDII